MRLPLFFAMVCVFTTGCSMKNMDVTDNNHYKKAVRKMVQEKPALTSRVKVMLEDGVMTYGEFMQLQEAYVALENKKFAKWANNLKEPKPTLEELKKNLARLAKSKRLVEGQLDAERLNCEMLEKRYEEIKGEYESLNCKIAKLEEEKQASEKARIAANAAKKGEIPDFAIEEVETYSEENWDNRPEGVSVSFEIPE